MRAIESSGILNSNPTESNFEHFFEREPYTYSNLCERFKHKKKDFSRQFFYIYGARLAKMKSRVAAKASSMWGQDVSVKRLAELQFDGGERCIIVGTLFKNQPLKPSILKEISEEFQLIPQQKQTKFFSDDDALILEDELQRIKLIGNVDVKSTVTGIVCAVLGSQDESGKFVAESICWAGPGDIPKPFTSLPDDRYILLISGLDFAHNADLLPMRLFLDYVTGMSGEPQQQQNTAKISLIIVAGNTFRKNQIDKDGKVANTEIESSSDLSVTLKLVDQFFSELVESIDVDLMPGEFDPTNYQLPQQPLHLAMFQQSGKLKSFRSVTNPYEAEVDGRIVAGSSGQPIEDVARYASIEDNLSILEETLKWGHFAPTAPDTLACYPYYDDDPFIINTQPDIYFTGNQEIYKSKLTEINLGNGITHKTRLISVPNFSTTSTCVLVNLNTLETEPISFQVKNLSVEN